MYALLLGVCVDKETINVLENLKWIILKETKEISKLSNS
jgi:hypothetical protein